MSIEREFDTIFINNLDQSRSVAEFLYAINSAKKAGFTSIKLDFSGSGAIYPNAATPIATLIKLCETERLEFIRIDNKVSVTATHLLHPLNFEEAAESEKRNVLNKVWRFDHSLAVAKLVDAYVEELSKLDRFEKGVLIGFEWCLNEIMDNVIQHSGVAHGFVMGQIHRSSKHIAFAISDNGQGIYNSLKDTLHAPKNSLDALTIAVQEGVTRDKATHQGNGMYGLYRIVLHNKGILNLISGNALYGFKEGNNQSRTDFIYYSKQRQCTTVEFQLDYETPVSIQEALNFGGRKYEPVNLRTENFQDEYGQYIYQIKSRTSGTGTRQAGEKARNEIINLYRETGNIIIVDFEDVRVISSSFADELIGKLVLEFGFFGFNNIIRLRNMNELIQGIVQRSVSQRMGESVNGKH